MAAVWGIARRWAKAHPTWRSRQVRRAGSSPPSARSALEGGLQEPQCGHDLIHARAVQATYEIPEPVLVEG